MTVHIANFVDMVTSMHENDVNNCVQIVLPMMYQKGRTPLTLSTSYKAHMIEFGTKITSS